VTRTTSDAFPPTDALPVQAERPAWRDTLAALRVRNFRLFAGTNLVAMTAAWMQRIAQDWLVLELSGSVAAVGITVAMQFTPMLVFGLLGGVLVDRYSKRTLMMITQGAFAMLSILLAVLTLVGVVEVWHIFLIAFMTGLVTVIDNPARQVFVNELVGPRNLRNAISINSSIFQLGGMIGPALSGLLMLGVGAGWSFALNGAACLAVVFTLSRIRTSELIHSPRAARTSGQLRQGLQYAVSKPTIWVPITLLASFSIFALTMPVLLASYADEVFGVGSGGYGLFNAMVAIGSLVGALASTRRASVRLREVVLTAGIAGVLQLTAGLMPTMIAFAASLVTVGIATLLFLTAANSLVQMSSNMGIRGRVMSLYVMVLLGGQALGGPLMGWVVEQFGTHTAMMLAGGAPALAAATMGLLLARRHDLRLRVSVRRAIPTFSIVGGAGRSS
jgi:MFS family permease